VPPTSTASTPLGADAIEFHGQRPRALAAPLTLSKETNDLKLLHTLLAALLALPALAQAPDNAPKMPADTEIVSLPSGLKYSVLRKGDSATKAMKGDMVRMHYTGWLTDGTVFDSSVTRGQPFVFELGRGEVIKGWDEGVALMNKGDKLKLTIPADLGYGARATGKIPANATLVFEVELLDIVWRFAQVNPSTKKTTPSGVGYEVLSEGKGVTPKPGDLVRFHFAVWRSSGEMLSCDDRESRGRPRPKPGATGTVGEMPAMGLSEALQLCPLDGSVRIELPASASFQRLPPNTKPESTIVWEVRLLEIVTVPSFSMPEPSKLVTLPSGLAYEVVKPGTGKRPAASDMVTVHYVGWLTNGNRFDTSYSTGQPASFSLGGVIKGWTEGVQLMQEGAIYKFVIPPGLAYGEAGAGADIPPNSTLVFQIELISTP